MKKFLVILMVVAMASFLFVGCLFTPPNQPPVITTTELPDATVGTAYTATVEATDADGDALAFSLVGPTDMVISTAGVISGWTPAEAGTEAVTVAVTDGTDSVSADFTITVIEPVPDPVIELTGIVVDPKTMDLIVGEEETITSVTATYEIRGTEVPIALGDCTFTSSAIEFATVSDAGLVTAVAEGEATITVSYEDMTDTVAVTVSAVEFDHIVVLPEEMTLYLGGVLSKSETIESVTAYFNDGTETPLDFDDYTCGLNPVGIVTVDDDEVTAVEVGETTITVTYEGMTDTIDVTVLAFKVDYIEVLPVDMTLFGVGDSEAITSITAYYNDGTEDDEIGFADCTYGLDPVNIVGITDDGAAGLVTAEDVGETTLTVTYEDKTDTIDVTVNPSLVSIGVLPATMSLFAGESEAIVLVTAIYSDNSDAGIALGDCIYESDKELVATVSDAGVVTAELVLVEDTATITVSYTEGVIEEEDTVVVTVKPIVINIEAILGVTAPVTGETPDTKITATAQYTGNIEWSPIVLLGETFADDQAYEATITLTAEPGYTLIGVEDDYFTVAGATATNAVDSGIVIAVFPATAATITTLAIPGVIAPVIGASPDMTDIDSAQYTGTITWAPVEDPFVVGGIYTATIILTAKVGFTLTGVAIDSFTVAGATATNAVDSGVVSALFPVL